MARNASGPVTLTPLFLPKLEPYNSLDRALIGALSRKRIDLREGDVVAVASKVVSLSEGRIVPLNRIRVYSKARQMARKLRMDARLAQLVIQEAEEILGGVKGFMLTTNNGILTANAGVDLKNAPPGTAMLWPSSPDKSAERIRGLLSRHYGTRIAVIIVDSRVTPMRFGTIGIAIGTSGFIPIRDERRNPDLYGRNVKVTQTNLADDLASSAHMLMGETIERVGAVIVRNSRIALRTSDDSKTLKLAKSKCLIANNLGKKTSRSVIGS